MNFDDIFLKIILSAVILALTFMGFLFVFAGCSGVNPIPDKYDSAIYSCVDVCNNYEKLGCVEGEPTSLGSNCFDVCVNILSLEEFRGSMGCIATAKTCAVARKCME
jgi:hypothetical protein